MRIGMILDGPFPPDPRVENEATTLVEAGHEVFLFCLDFSGNLPLKEEYRGIQIRRHRTGRWMYSLSSLAYSFPLYHWLLIPGIKRFLIDNGIGIIHIHDIQVARAVFTINKKLSLPVVLDLHENRPEIMKYYAHVNSFPGRWLISPKTWKRYEFRYIRKASHVITVTKEAADHYVESTGADPAKFHVVPNTVLTSFYQDHSTETEIVKRYETDFGILYLGDTGLRRGLATAIRSLKYLVEKIPKVRLIVVGKSKADGILEELVRKEGLEEYVDFEGWQDMKKFPSYIQASRIGICPIHKNLHHDTTYANKLFQYLAFGLPIVVSDCDAQQHLVEEYQCGEVFKDRNEKDMAEKILKLAMDKDYYDQISENGRNAVRNDLNWDIFCKELLNLYEVEEDRSEQ